MTSPLRREWSLHSDATGLLWSTTIAGYLVQMVAAPRLALTHDSRAAASFIDHFQVGGLERSNFGRSCGVGRMAPKGRPLP